MCVAEEPTSPQHDVTAGEPDDHATDSACSAAGDDRACSQESGGTPEARRQISCSDDPTLSLLRPVAAQPADPAGEQLCEAVDPAGEQSPDAATSAGEQSRDAATSAGEQSREATDPASK